MGEVRRELPVLLLDATVSLAGIDARAETQREEDEGGAGRCGRKDITIKFLAGCDRIVHQGTWHRGRMRMRMKETR